MMALKITGGILIMASATLMGIFYSNREALREKQLLEMKNALTILKNEIRFALTPFGEAALSISERVKGPANVIFSAAGTGALNKSGAGADKIWQESIKRVEKASFFAEEDIEAFLSLGKTLGRLDKHMQNQSLELLIEYIDRTVSDIRQRYPKQSKMYRSLGFLGGALLTVILV